jgi:membrane protease YdiL (CAAX protease family)
MSATTDLRKPWQRKAWVQVLAILLGYIPAWLMALLSQTGGRSLTMKGVLTYTTAGAAISIVALLLLLQFLCGEKPGGLNLKAGVWWKDVPGGIALGALTLLAKFALDPVILKLMPRTSGGESPVVGLFGEMAQNPWLLALFLGPVLMMGVAAFEELSRVFFISRWWRISPAAWWRWVGVAISAVLFGLVHIYQGPAGAVSVAINGLILAIWYVRSGRLLPLMVSHYLYDALQIVQVVILIRQGVIVL